MHRIILALLGSALLTLTSGCQTNAATGRTQFATMSREQEIQLGESSKPELVAQYGGVVPSAPLQAYVTEVGLKLAAYTESDNPTLPWEFIVLDSDVINAFALPGGKVFISRGLLQEFDNEAQLAGVLGHEIGHVTGQHVDERVTQATGLGILASAAAAAAGTQSAGMADLVNVIVGTGGQGYLLSFGRDQESEADDLGLRYMIAAGYDPQGLIEVLEVLERASQGSSQPEILSTHPNPGTRLTRVRRLLDTTYAGAAANPNLQLKQAEFQQRAVPYLTR